MNDKDPRNVVVAKAMKDPAFRAELKKDAAAAITKATGVKVPAGTTVKVVEDSASVVHLVIPADPQGLSETELKKVAGGAGTYTKPDCCYDDSTGRPIKCAFG